MVLTTDQSAASVAESAVKPHLHFRSRNLDQALAFFHDKDLHFDVARRDADALDVHINGFYLPAGLFVGLTEYGTRATVRPNPQRLDYWIFMPIRGRMQTEFRGEQYVSDVRHGCILSFLSMGESRNLVDVRAARMTVVLSHESLHRQLTLLLGQTPDAALRPALEFAPGLDLTRGHGRNIAQLAHLAFRDFERRGPMTRNVLAMSSFEQFIINELLLSHPHNYTHRVHGSIPSIAPRDVKRAIDYIEAHLQAPITLADIVGAAGVPGRTLFKHFEEYRGISPMEYLRQARFAKVRQALRRCGDQGTVSDIAMSWGFTHLGRFSLEYRKRYGEPPSETLRRSRAGH
jgi:AraC-like DNA-binding protein